MAGYMGDDRVGGHVWKFVSDGLYRPGDAAGNRRLLSSGTPLRRALPRRTAPASGACSTCRRRLDPNPGAADPKPFIPPRRAHAGRLLRQSQGAVADGRLPGRQRARGHALGPPGGPGGPSRRRQRVHRVHRRSRAGRGCGRTSTARCGASRRTAATCARRASAGSGSPWAGPPTPRSGGRVFAQPDNMIFDAAGDLWMATDISGAYVNQRRALPRLQEQRPVPPGR